MELGTVSELVNTRSVIKHIRKHNKDMEQGVGVGSDYSLANGIAVSEGVASTPYIAWVKAMNNLAVSGARISGVRTVMLLPESVTEEEIKLYMKEFNSLADEEDIQILGGHTEVGRAYNFVSFVVTAYGMVEKYRQNIKAISEGDKIVMIGLAGLMGTDLIARQKTEELSSRFARSYIERAFFDKTEYAVKNKVDKLIDLFGDDVLYMHDVSQGGIYGALWQLGVKIKHGICIEHATIPIRQETVEICNYFDINPYLLDGTGALVAVVKDKEKDSQSDDEDRDVIDENKDKSSLMKRLTDMGFPVEVIGTVTKDNNKTVLLGDEKEPETRFLSPIKGDEIYKIIDRR